MIGATFYYSDDPENNSNARVVIDHTGEVCPSIILKRGDQSIEVDSADLEALISTLQVIKEDYFP